MSKRKILTSQPLLERYEVLGTPEVALIGAGPIAPTPGETSKGDVLVVRRATHDPNTERRDALKASPPALNVLLRARNHMADVDQLSRFRIGHKAFIGVLVLCVEHSGHGFRRSRSCRMVRNVLDTVRPEPKSAV